MINIYIGLSKNQISSYEEIITGSKNVNCENILISNKTLKNNLNIWDKIIYSEESFNNQSKGILSELSNIILKIKQYKKILKKLNPYKKEKNITLYFTYIEDILTNYLFFSFNKNIKGVVVEDGTLNYYPHTIKSLSKKKVLLKWFLSNLYNVRFKFYKGHSSGIEYKHVIKQYVRVPKLSQFPEKSVKLNFPLRSTQLTNTILIIGQEGYINQKGEKKYLESLQKMFYIIKSKAYFNEISEIYYKPHRHGKRVNIDWLRSQFPKIIINYLDDNMPLEDLYFNKLGSKYIYTFDSSALLNIFLEFKNKNAIEYNVILSYNKLLEPVFKKFKFNIYK